jgi:hypothetical protein
MAPREPLESGEQPLLVQTIVEGTADCPTWLDGVTVRLLHI